VISELIASNDNGIRDEDRERPDWVEVLNRGDVERNLQGWFLTDDAQTLDKWQFPEVILEPGQRVVVFASGKDRAAPGAELHTNFKLRSKGEFLALVEPDGQTVAFDFGEAFPPQVSDVSYGLPEAVEHLTLHAPGDTGQFLVPRNGSLGTSWTAANFDATSWSDVQTGIGYGSSFGSVVATNVQSQVKGINSSAYLRLPFDLTDASTISSLSLTVQYNDGFVAYLNGTEIARRNAPAEPSWNSKAPARRGSSASLVPEVFDLAEHLDLLQTGPNVVAFQVLNSNSRSSRFLLVPELTAVSAGELDVAGRRYFVNPTPADANGEGVTTSIYDVTHAPAVPVEGEPLLVTARATSSRDAAPTVQLYYKIMFGDEIVLPMFDDGNHGDGEAGDGLYGATIPGGVAAAGEMIRYRITAEDGPDNLMRSPTFADPERYQQYFGTVVADPNVDSNLPVMQLFFEHPEQADTKISQAQGAIFFNGELYDNVFADLHGFSTAGLPKASHDIFFPRDHKLLLVDGAPREKDTNEITNLLDPTLLRQPLSYFIFRQTGTPSLAAFQARVEQNGEFLGIFDLIEDADNEYLERVGLDPRGALYKLENSLSASGAFEKKTRTFEDESDLRDFVSGLNLKGDARTAFIFDNVNVPAMLNYMVGLVLTAESDCCGRNYFAYRDTEGTGEWRYLPWDVDKSLGRAGTDDPLRFRFRLDIGSPFAGSGNLLISALFDTPAIRQMYLRRLRTLMDEVLRPPGTPLEDRPIEQEILRKADQLAPDIPLEFARWGGDGLSTSNRGALSSWAKQIDFFIQEYWPRRRVSLYGLNGDMNFDGKVDVNDIGDFVTGLTKPAEYKARYGKVASLRGDIDRDRGNDLDYDDIARFAGLIESGSVRPGPTPEAQAATPQIDFGQVDANPVSGNQDEEFIELKNPNAVAVDISGWQLSGGIDHTFPAGVVIPAGGSLYVSPNVNAFRARATGPTGGEGRFVQGNYKRHIANAGETIRLRTAAGADVAEIMTPDVTTPDPGNAVASAAEDLALRGTVTDIALDAVLSDTDNAGDIDLHAIRSSQTPTDAGTAAAADPVQPAGATRDVTVHGG